ncbi:hypothetical protein LV716_18415 [Flagellimonas sp. HMM57]|uniref:hypothetical protein n=1 Tax=unclassified Flagellimonas TaxID=2644544 RepID=UPI0013D248DD|nr:MULTISPECIES: hypothetical protein [unclassified Flagellimonas]UII76213.1 hypothetical protein LV716_18415 [Flagellimonas sp. HMM57]
MLDFLKTYFTKGNTFYGLKIYQVENTIKFHLVEAIKKKGELTIANSQDFDELQMLSKLCKTSVPLYLICNTTDVITKQLEATSSLSSEAAVERMFPGLDLDVFYYQISKLKNHLLISIAKKNGVDSYLEKLKEMNFRVTGFSLGLSTLGSLINFINNETIYTNTNKIAFDTGPNSKLSISKVDNATQVSYTINGLQMKNSALVAFSGILDFLSDSAAHNSNFKPTVQSLQNDFKQSRVFKIVSRSSLVVLLIILLSNFLIFSYYFDEVASLKENLAFDNENKKNLMALTDAVAEKEKKVDAVLSVSNSRSSYYLDELGTSIPKSILLDGIQYQPLIKPVQISKPIEVNIDELIVTGNCINSEDFSSWLIYLERLEWVRSVETLEYDYKNQNSSNFKIKISATAP